jgi:hypothetical protein
MRASKNQNVNIAIVVISLVVGGICLCGFLAWDTVVSFVEFLLSPFR